MNKEETRQRQGWGQPRPLGGNLRVLATENWEPAVFSGNGGVLPALCFVVTLVVASLVAVGWLGGQEASQEAPTFCHGPDRA